ncbi:MAG TPA: hypothetical protein VH437_00835 [Terriglobales bacterium]
MTAVVLSALLFLVPFACAQQQQPKSCVAPHYKIVPVPIHPTQINNAGQISGTTKARKAALWSQKRGVRLAPIPSGYVFAEGVGLNAAGHLIGVVTTEDGSERHAFLFVNEKTVLLPGEQSRATAINDSDEIAGEARIAGKSATTPVVWRNRVPVDLGACCGGTAFALNNQGQVAGESYDAEGHYHAFLWDQAHGMKTIGPVDDYSSAAAINNTGRLVVQAFPRTFLYENGKLNPLDVTADPMQPRSLNDCGGMVGSFGKFSDASKAFVWDQAHGLKDLNDLVTSATGWKLEVAAGINNRGEIVGWGDYKGEEDSGFLLLPQW